MLKRLHKTKGKTKNKDYTDRDYDVRTGHIAKRVAEKIGCKALINWDWRKETKPARNYNNKTDAEDDRSFISHLEAAGTQETLVLWIHGAKTAEITKEETQYNKANKKSVKLDAVLGYGQGGKLSAKQDTADSFIKNLCREGLQTVSASKARNKFCANEPDNMCQWFNQQKDEKGKPKYPNVQSLQLEIKYAGFRNNDDEADKTADILTAVLQKHLADEKWANEAYQEITSIFGLHLENAMEEVGQYLIKTFYGNDIKLAEKRETEYPYPFHQLVRKIQKHNDNKPSKTWLYNAVDIAIDREKYKGIPTYKKLGHSHKVYLTHVKDEKEKVKLITEAHDQGYTVAQLRQEIAKTKEPKQNVTIASLPSDKVLQKLPLQRLKKLASRADAEIKTLNDKIKDYESKQERLNKLIEKKSETEKKK